MRRALVLLCLLGCGPRGRTKAPEFEGPTDVTEVTGLDLAPKAEIDALLEGTSELGRGAARIKVAVLPFDVRSGDEAMGGMVADVIAHALTGAEGVTVLERERVDILVDEVERTGKSTEADIAKLTQKAKLAGVDAYVLGTVHGGKKDGVVYCRLVDTAGGVRRHELEIPLDRRRWRDGVAEKSRDLARELGVKDRGRRTEAPHDLDADALKKATQARELQYSGKTAEAAKLYAEAMPKPSTAWSLEVDYLTLMHEIEMDEWVRARADAVLQRMPTGPSTICSRARLLALRLPQRNTSSADLEDARLAVRVAASCGDPSVIATSLMEYADVARSIDTPLAMEAIERAHALVGPAPGWDRCEVDLRRTWYRTVDGKGGAELRREFMGHADACAKVHNYHAAALAAMVAADWAWSLEDAIADLAKGVKWAELAGGIVVNDLRVAHSNMLRRAGYNSAADDELLALVRTWVQQTIEIHGALPPTEARIDDELLERAKVKRTTGVVKAIDKDAELRAVVVRRGLAAVLQQWSARTRADSGPEAAFYADLAADLDPALRPESAAPLERLRARKIDPEALQTEPHREKAPDYPFALETLVTMYKQARDTDAPVAEREKIIAQFERISKWLGARQYERITAWMQAQHQADLGNLKHALSELRALDALAGDDPRWDVAWRYPLEVEILHRQGASATDETMTRWLATAKKVSAPAWVDIAGRVEALRLERAPKTEPERAKTLLDIGNELISKKQWLPAADAAFAGAALLRRANISGGTQQSIEVVYQRMGVIDRLEDPVRSALARTDLLWEISSLYANAFEHRHVGLAFANDPNAQQLMLELDKQVKQLVDAGRARDAVRVIVSIPGIAPRADELLAAAERLAPSFAQSLEHPLLMGTWWLRVSERSEGPAYREALRRAFELLDKTERRDLATAAMVGLVKTAPDDAQLAADYERCVAFAAGAPGGRLACLGGMSSYVVLAGGENRRITKPELFRRGLEEMDELWQRHGAKMAETDRVLLKESGILLAIAAGDFRIVDALLGELVTYFEKQSDSPHLGNFGNAIWVAARLQHPQEAIAAIERVAGSASSGDRFLAMMAADTARSAWQLGDGARGDRLYTAGRAAAERAYADLLFRYDLLAGDRALAAKKHADATAAYVRVRDSDEAKRNLGVTAAAKVRLAAASLLRDPKHDVVAAVSTDAAMLGPCAEADLLELRAAASFARRQCDEGKQLREQARTLGLTCREPTYRVRSENACGKPFAPIIGETAK